MSIRIKRIYSIACKEDGCRILVDGVWPRGVSKQEAQIEYWKKAVAPSKELRQWFQHDPAKYNDFKEAYKKELNNVEEKREALSALKQLIKAQEKEVTLLFGAKEETFNHANVLKEILDHQPV